MFRRLSRQLEKQAEKPACPEPAEGYAVVKEFARLSQHSLCPTLRECRLKHLE
jgi:hypothetical protein